MVSHIFILKPAKVPAKTEALVDSQLFSLFLGFGCLKISFVLIIFNVPFQSHNFLISVANRTIFGIIFLGKGPFKKVNFF